MSVAKTETVTHLVCPTCDTRMGSIDHIQIGQSFGPWACHNEQCKTSVSGTMTGDGPVVTVSEHGYKPRFALLRFRDLFVVLKDRYGVQNPDYFYHSHQCPTNLMRDVAHVFDAEGSDPHGVMRFVCSVPWSEHGETLLGEDGCSLAAMLALFGTDGQPSETEWPEDERGVLPFISQMQRAYQKNRSPKA